MWSVVGFILVCAFYLVQVGGALFLWFFFGGLDLSGYFSQYYNSKWKWNRLACTIAVVIYFTGWYYLLQNSPLTIGVSQ